MTDPALTFRDKLDSKWNTTNFTPEPVIETRYGVLDGFATNKEGIYVSCIPSFQNSSYHGLTIERLHFLLVCVCIRKGAVGGGDVESDVYDRMYAMIQEVNRIVHENYASTLTNGYLEDLNTNSIEYKERGTVAIAQLSLTAEIHRKYSITV